MPDNSVIPDELLAIGEPELVGSRGRARLYGRPEPEGRDHDYVYFVDDAEQRRVLKSAFKKLAEKGWSKQRWPGGGLTVSRPDGAVDVSLYGTERKNAIHKAWALMEQGLSKEEAWAQVNSQLSQDPRIQYRTLSSTVQDRMGDQVLKTPVSRVVADAVYGDGHQQRIGLARLILGYRGKNMFEYLSVDPEFQGKGIGKELLTRLMRSADATIPGAPIYTRAQPFNNKAVTREQLMDFYAKFGFKPLNVEGTRLPQWDDPVTGELGYAIGTGPGAMLRVGPSEISKQADVVTPLQDQQQRVVDKLKNNSLIVAHGMGSGKTLSSIAAAEALGMPTTVLTPASLVNNYKKEIAKHTDDSRVPYHVESINRATLKGMDMPGGFLVVDEAHNLRNPGTQRRAYIKDISGKADKLMLLTGTPSYNNVADVAPLVNLVHGKTVLPESPSQFNEQFVDNQVIAPSLLWRILGVRPGEVQHLKNTKELADALRGHVDYYVSKTNFPERKDKDVVVDMSPKQQEIYDYVEGRLPLWARWKVRLGLPPSKSEAKELNSFLGGVRQASNTPGPYIAGTTPLEAAEMSPKLLAAAKSIIERAKKDPNFKSLSYSNYMDAGVLPLSALLTQNKIDNAVFHGGLTPAEKKDLVDRFNSGKLKALLGTSSAAEGLDLKGTKLVQILEPHFNKPKIEQVVGRAIRYKSHEALPPEERKVDVEHYYSRPSTGFLQRLIAGKREGVDQWLEENADRKQALSDELIRIMKDVT